MKRMRVLACFAFIVCIAVASVCAAEGFGEFNWAGSTFTYNGQIFNRLTLIRYEGIVNIIDGSDVLEMKVIMDKNVGRLYQIKTKSRIFEDPLKHIKGTMADGMTLHIDL